MGLSIPAFELAQVLAQVPIIIEQEPGLANDAALQFSGRQFFAALISGVVLAFAFQLLLTNLGVAAGISMLGGGGSSSKGDRRSDRERRDDTVPTPEVVPTTAEEADRVKHSDRGSSNDHSSGGLGATIRKIGFALGLATLITVTISLFVACFLAVKLALFPFWLSGLIMGLVIWATYFSLLVWVSSTTVGSLVGSVVNSATSGFQAIAGTAAAAIGGQAVNKQVVSTAEAAAAAVRRELGSAIDPVTIRENLEDYVERLKTPTLDRQAIRADFERLLEDPSIEEIAGSEGIERINRQTFIDLVSNRSDLSRREVDSIADELEGVWNRKVRRSRKRDSMGELVDYIKSASAEQLLGKDFSGKLTNLVDELRRSRQAQESTTQQLANQGQQLANQNRQLAQQSSQGQGQGQGPISQAVSMGMNSLMGMVMGRADLSDLDAQKVISQLKGLRDQVSEQSSQLPAQLGGGTDYNPIQADVENYILNAYPWQLKGENLEREFRDLLYDPEADPETVANQLEQISRSDFADWLGQKGLFTQAEIREKSLRLDSIRQEILVTARAAQEREKSVSLMREVEQYLLTTPQENLTPEKIQSDFKPILEDPDADYEHLSNRLAQFDRTTFERILTQRGLDPVEASAIANELELARDRALQDSQEQAQSARAKAESAWSRVKSYLQGTSQEELTSSNIQHELSLLLKDPQSGASAVRARASRFNRDDLVQLLSQREDISEERANQIIDQVEGTWTRVRYAPQQLAGKAQEQYSQAQGAITEYLRSTGKEELNPEGIQRDLQKLLDDPQAGTQAIRSRLASMDRDTLVQLLTQRGDLSEDQVNQVINEVQNTLQTIARTPRRLARRTQTQVRSFQDSISDYLRSTDREALNPDGIQRDFQLLLNDPRAGAESLRDRLTQIDRDTLVALLSQREDVSEDDVGRTVDQILSVRDRVGSQVRSLQIRVESAIEGVIDRIRSYLNGLERPELNYEGVRDDLRTLFDDPQAGFDALRDRLSQFDRDTLVAIISSREDISESDVNRIIDQIEGTRNRVLQRAERIQQQTLHRVEQVKEEAQKQAEETRKAAAAASWWLFLTALVSAIASAGAGALASID